MQRIITATDPCGNVTTKLQTIHVGDGSGPVIEGVVDLICEDTSIPVVTAYDACAEEFTAVTMQEDTLDTVCDGLVIERTWTAVNICGHITTIHQIIIINDTIPPVIIIPVNSVIHNFLGNNDNLASLSEIDLMNLLNALDSNSVLIETDCGQVIVPLFTVEISYSNNCLVDGYYERRTYTWVATDICGNSSSVSFTIDIVDNVPPVFVVVPTNVTIICAPLPPPAVVFTDDATQSVTIVYTEVIESFNPGVFLVTRTWVATDACGNVTTYKQYIKWIPDTFLECHITLPDGVDCNSHGVFITSSHTGGNGPVSYDWKIVGTNCFIQGGQGTPAIDIYVGWTDVNIILTTTDAFGCVSICTAILSCEFSVDNLNGGTISDGNNVADNNAETPPISTSKDYLQKFNIWPNPANRSVTISFESMVEDEVNFSIVNFLGQVVQSKKINAIKGFNNLRVDLDNIQEGSYLMEIKTGKEIHTKVVLIMRSN